MRIIGNTVDPDPAALILDTEKILDLTTLSHKYQQMMTHYGHLPHQNVNLIAYQFELR